jgi:hypothetical protein
MPWPDEERAKEMTDTRKQIQNATLQLCISEVPRPNLTARQTNPFPFNPSRRVTTELSFQFPIRRLHHRQDATQATSVVPYAARC